ncbi:MAG: DUF1501 domain-containing protein [Planctomycetaceae bacterium]|nr:DUF1501 domain-containing protein [Planctomycetaceae bacterium]
MLLRRDFLAQSAAALAAGSMTVRSSAEDAPAAGDSPRGKAEHCVVVWLGGGAGQIDTWDPKRRGDPKEKTPGSYYDAIDTAIPGTQIVEHFPRCAKILDRFNLVRTVHHDVIDEHAAATNRMHTGRQPSETVVYPSIGSVIAYQRGPVSDQVPAYVLIGYPSTTRGPGFLGAKGNYVYLTDTNSGPAGLARPVDITANRQARREALLAKVREEYLARSGNSLPVQNYDAMIAEALRYGGPEFTRIFNLKEESGSLRDDYGGEFGQRCLLTRRLLQSGVRFVEVSHNLNFLNGTGWDVHNEGILNQHKLILELDQALAALVTDLERVKLLDKTLIVVAGEFGRPAGFDGGGGRGHHGKCFTVALAGGGLKNGVTIGETDELAMQIVSRPVSVPDLHATIYAALGIDPHEPLYAGDRPVPTTDGGQPIRELFG